MDFKLILAAIHKHAPSFKPYSAIILGSGLGDVVEVLTDQIIIPYSSIPGFPISTVQGQQGRMVLGLLNGKPAVCLQGRPHRYEGDQDKAFVLLIRTLKCLGCEELLVTNAAGSLREHVLPGRLMLITDHINFQLVNPLIGPNQDEFGPRFFAMDPAYDPILNNRLRRAAQHSGIALAEGIYLAVMGPNYETPAEIRAFRILGADAVAMSLVPEVLVARHCGLRVAGISVISNLAAGLSSHPANHEEVLAVGAVAAQQLKKLILSFAKEGDVGESIRK